jgi:SAM-dependent methyltransferase
MKERLLHFLSCPLCDRAVEIDATSQRDGAEIIEAELACRSCRARWPVTRGIPRFADLGLVNEEKAATAARFGWQWQHFTQTDEKYEQQFLGWIAPVTPEFFRNKIVLEGGCGKGRHTRIASEYGAREVVGIDLSDAVETAFAGTRDLPNVHIVQADIYHLPFKRIFDYAFSVGVLHHLPDPRGGFISLASKVRAGGHLSAWVYGAENNQWIVRWLNPLRQRITSQMNPRLLLQLSKLPTTLVFAATKLIYGPLNRSRKGSEFAKHLFYNDYLNAISGFGWREQHTIVFDHLVAPTSHYISRPEFEEWWEAIQATDVTIGWHNQNSWRGFGRIDNRSGDDVHDSKRQVELYVHEL